MFETKDSGERAQLANGMERDSEAGKTDYTLMLDGPMFERWAALLGRGAVKYQPRNWCRALAATDKAEREKTKERFKRSAMRHFMQWMRGDTDEDHAAAVMFNLNGYEAMLLSDHLVAAAPAPAQIVPTIEPQVTERAAFKLGDRVRVRAALLQSGLVRALGSQGVVDRVDRPALGTPADTRVLFADADVAGYHWAWFDPNDLEKM